MVWYRRATPPTPGYSDPAYPIEGRKPRNDQRISTAIR